MTVRTPAVFWPQMTESRSRFTNILNISEEMIFRLLAALRSGARRRPAGSLKSVNGAALDGA